MRKQHTAARDAIDDIKETLQDPKPIHNGVRYVGANRDRAVGSSDRKGRHYDEISEEAPDEGSAASVEHEAD